MANEREEQEDEEESNREAWPALNGPSCRLNAFWIKIKRRLDTFVAFKYRDSSRREGKEARLLRSDLRDCNRCNAVVTRRCSSNPVIPIAIGFRRRDQERETQDARCTEGGGEEEEEGGASLEGRTAALYYVPCG